MATTTITIECGAALRRKCTVTSGGVAYPLTNVTRMKFRAKKNLTDADDDAAIEQEINLEDEDNDLAAGIFYLKVDGGNTAIEPGDYRYGFIALQEEPATSPIKFPRGTGLLRVTGTVNNAI